jgi:hypothetical protein
LQVFCFNIFEKTKPQFRFTRFRLAAASTQLHRTPVTCAFASRTRNHARPAAARP